MPHKSRLPEFLKSLHRKIERQNDISIRAYRFDGEFGNNGGITSWLNKKGIAHEKTIIKRYHMNGVVERGFRSEREKSSSMLYDATVAGQILAVLGSRTTETLGTATIPGIFFGRRLLSWRSGTRTVPPLEL